MMDYSVLAQGLMGTPLAPLADCLPRNFPDDINHGDLPAWLDAIGNLPQIIPDSCDLETMVRIGEPAQCSDEERRLIREQLLRLVPWRKGPFELFGIQIDTEWRSDWKWDRLVSHISPLENRTVLDVGCGNGYHCWRMAGAGARRVIGVDGYLLFIMQYWAVRHFLPSPEVSVLPLRMEQLPKGLEGFDTVFSMGVLYHHRSPFDHLIQLRDSMRSGGELVLESLVIDGEEGMTLIPRDRYAGMPNVWLIPSSSSLESWLLKCGFVNIRLVDENITTTAEQRSTDWMPYRSLSDALDSSNYGLTIEGLPAPKRAIFLANKI